MSKKINRREFLKVAGVATAATTAGSLLGACGPKPTPAPTVTPVLPEATPVSVATPIKKEKVSLLLWHNENVPSRVEAFQVIIDEFNAANPDIEVKQEPYAIPDRYTKIPGAIGAGNPPDLCQTPADLLFTLPDDTYFPVDDIVAEIDEKYKYAEGAKKGLSWDGHTWLVPMYTMTHVLLYCTDRLEEAGFDKPPTTWEEWLTQCKAMTHDDKYAIAFPLNKHSLTVQCVSDVMRTNGGKIFDEGGNIVFDSPENVESYKMCAELAKYTPPDAPAYTFAESNLALITGQVAMAQLFGAPWARFPDEAPDRADFLKAALIPIPPGGMNANLGGTNAYCLFTEDPDKQEAAKRFLLYLHEPETNGRWLSTFHPLLFLPCTEAAMESKSFYEHPVVQRYSSEVSVLMESVNYIFQWGQLYDEPIQAIGPITGDLTLAQVLQKIVLENMDPADAVKWGQERMIELTS